MTTNERVREILRQCSREEMTQVGTGLIHQRLVDYDEFAKQIVGETILAILAADTRDVVYTTHDKAISDGVVSRVVDSVRNHWSFV